MWRWPETSTRFSDSSPSSGTVGVSCWVEFFYALDTVLFVLASDWLVLAFHVFVLFWIFMGLKANMQLKAQSR